MEGSFSTGAPQAMVNNNEVRDAAAAADLPPGFRFHPTDDEIIMHYLVKKVVNRRFSARAIGEADFNKCEPWDLPKMAKTGEKEWFFFCHRDKKYPTGTRTNRATESGYWKATGKDKEIYKDKENLVGMKKTLVFYKGRAPRGEKTNWVMHEYRLEAECLREDWVVCKVFHKNTEIKRTGIESIPESPPALAPPTVDPIFERNAALPLGQALEVPKPLFMASSQNPFMTTPYNMGQFQNPIYFPNMVFLAPQPPPLAATGLSYQQQHAQSSMMMSMMSQSQDTGVSIENVSNEITSVPSSSSSLEGDFCKEFDQEFEGLSFSHSLSDLEFLWNL